MISLFCQQALGARPNQASLLNEYKCILDFGMEIVVPMIAQVLGQIRTRDDISC